MSEPLVLVKTEDGISTVTINRPHKLNAVNTELATAIRDALDNLSSSARVVILTGSGRAFVGGADIRQMADLEYS